MNSSKDTLATAYIMNGIASRRVFRLAVTRRVP
jgi:hypothetical protein